MPVKKKAVKKTRKPAKRRTKAVIRKLNREERQEAFRQRLDFGKSLTAIDKELKRLCDHRKYIASEDIQRSKAVMDHYQWRINKIVPSLKAIELTGEAGEPLAISIVRFSDIPTK